MPSQRNQAAPPLRFGGLDEEKPGSLDRLLRAAYEPLLAGDEAGYWREEALRWAEFDKMAFTVAPMGRCVFLTWLDDRLAGFGSFDPRGAPEYALVGHNCVDPRCQGQGIGGHQLAEILRRLRALEVARIKVSTLDTPFFLPARKMYERAGFKLVSRTHAPAPAAHMLFYELERPQEELRP